ncbi:MAG TPA: Maf family protein [Dehalococcoidia bacterium]|nr:Maf family protein [Dehalococcoidia bacterium]
MVEQNAQSPRLLLASASPRRRELLAAVGIKFETAPVDVDETMDSGVPASLTVKRLAIAKAAASAERYPDSIVLAADTLVSVGGVALGKPADPDQAREMLRALRGRHHDVFTGVCVLAAHNGIRCVRVVRTSVRMRLYSDAEIEQSIGRGTPFDKAGAYAIQDEGLAPAAGYDGCYCNVIGLPLWAAFELLAQTKVANDPRMPADSLPACRACPLRPNSGQSGTT